MLKIYIQVFMFSQCLSQLSITVIKATDKSNLDKKEFISPHRLQPIFEGQSGTRNLELMQWHQKDIACWFAFVQWSHCPVQFGPSYVNILSIKCPCSFTCSQANGDIFSAEVLFPRWLYFVSLAKGKTNKTKQTNQNVTATKTKNFSHEAKYSTP